MMSDLLPEPSTLEGRVVRIVPLQLEHAADLAHHATPETFRYFPAIAYARIDEEAMCEYIRHAWAREATKAFAVCLAQTGEAIGSSCYLDIRVPHSGLEIGMTWYGEAHRGTAVNPESKLLLLEHAFETLNYERVQLKTDGRNLVSQAAIRKLGAQYEGTLRRHMRMPDGYMRDTVMFSILRDEWPTVKAGLIARIDALTSRS
jgi:N-acetyltransferase